jgi:hypothetical protein
MRRRKLCLHLRCTEPVEAVKTELMVRRLFVLTRGDAHRSTARKMAGRNARATKTKKVQSTR